MHFDIKQYPTREQVLEVLKAHWTPTPETEHVPLEQALGRVTAEPLYSLNTLPVCRGSACDGYAVRSADFSGGNPDTMKWVKDRDYAPADMGDDFPDAFDTVIAVEDVSFDENGRLHLADGFHLVKGQCVRERGSTIRQSELMLPANEKITPEHLALLATGGIRMVPVLRKIRVGFIPTGSELIPAGSIPDRGQTVECNGLMIASILEQWGAECVRFPIVRDDKAQLEQILDEALAVCDLVLINGGSSKGGEDFNARLLERRGDFFSYGVRCVPGRPVGLTVINGKPVVNVPGPVMAAWVSVDWLVRSMVHTCYGTPIPQRKTVRAKLSEPVKKPPFLEVRLQVQLTQDAGSYTAAPIPRSVGLVSLAQMNGMLIAPVGCTGYAAGDFVDVELI